MHLATKEGEGGEAEQRSCSFIPPPASPASALTFGESRIANFAAADVGLAFAFA